MTWDDFQAIVNPLFGQFNTLALILLLILISLLLVPRRSNLPGPSFLQTLPYGEVYPILQDSRTTSRTLLNLKNKYGDVFEAWIGPSRITVSANPSDIAQILSNTDEFVRPDGMLTMFDSVVPGGLFAMPKHVHETSRRKLKANFNYVMLQNCHSYLTEAVNELCQRLDVLARKGVKSVDISPILANATFRVICRIAFGYDMTSDARAQFHSWVEQLIDEMLKDVLAYPFRQALTVFGARKRLFEARSNIYSVCKGFIRRRVEESAEERAARPPDALDAILALTTDVAVVTSLTVEFAIAGSHTTSQALAWCIYQLSQSPDVETRVTEEIDQHLSSRPLSEPLKMDDVLELKYLQKVWKENNRIHPAGAFILRKAREATTLQGSQSYIPRGAQVMALLQAAQNSHDIWRNPDSFDPDRWGDRTERREGDCVPVGAYVPFSLGERSCIGRFLADHEGVLVLAELYRRFRFGLSCPPDEVVTCTSWVEGPRSASVEGGSLDRGVPVEISLRSRESEREQGSVLSGV